MRSFSLFRNVTPKRFDYQPRYYDEEKDDLETRLAANAAKGDRDVEAMKLRISDGMKRMSSDNRAWKKKLTRQYNRRIVVILMILMVLTFILVLTYFPALAEIMK